MFILRYIAKLIYAFRDFVWKYPDNLFIDDTSVYKKSKYMYMRMRPFSHVWLSMIVYVLVIFLLVGYPQAVLRVNDSLYIEGSVVGVDESGNLLGLQKINPLVQTSIQLEKDLSALIYESLIVVDQNEEIIPVLIESYEEVEEGNHYSFKLKQGVKWHDGTELTTKDVEATFNLLKEIDKSSDTSSAYSSAAANQFDEIIINSEYEFELKLKDDKSVLPTFAEALTFKIMPAAHIYDLNKNSILTSEPSINRKPIGTGPYMNLTQPTGTDSIIKLVKNPDYHEGSPNISTLYFQLFPDEEQAVTALQTGKIHAIAGLSSGFVEDVDKLGNYQTLKSNVIYNQYWALHFNLDENSGNESLNDKNVRKAIAYSIDKENILRETTRLGEEANGTIPKISFAYNDEIDELGYNPQKASELLDEAGWKMSSRTGLRQKGTNSLELEIVYVDNIDRKKVAESIKQDLDIIGITVKLVPETIDTVNNAYILTKNFDILLYGQTTFLDPDRYELYHSSQIGIPSQGGNNDSTGLNISSFISDSKGKRIDKETQELVDVPKVDKLLEDSRAIIDQAKRKEKLFEFQEILADEVPTVFLYHPQIPYVVNKRVEGIDMSHMSNQQDRFNNIYEWEINNN